MSDATTCPCTRAPIIGPKTCEHCGGATTWIAGKGVVVCLACAPEWTALVGHNPHCPHKVRCDGCGRTLAACDAEFHGSTWLTPRCEERRRSPNFGQQVDLLEAVYIAGGLLRFAEQTGRPFAELRREVLAAQRAVVPVFQKADAEAVAEVREDVEAGRSPAAALTAILEEVGDV
jgi:hypothetical protein